jgi:hypothetical protein
MTKLKLNSVQDDKPVKLTVALPAALHRDLVAYADLLALETGQNVAAEKLIAPMLERFISGDRGFAKARRTGRRSMATPPSPSTPSNAPD